MTLTICITGASGFIASHIVQLALEKGYNVHGTVRDATDKQKTSHLRKMAGGNTLKLFSVDLCGPDGEFDEAVTGCDAVIHTATPVVLGSKNGEKEILEPALQGTENLLKSVERAGIKTFVLTSSMASVAPRPEPAIKTEQHWSDAEDQKTRGNWYGATKTLQEKLVQQRAEALKHSIRCNLSHDGTWTNAPAYYQCHYEATS